MQRVDDGDRAPGGGEQLDVLGVAEGERRSPGDRHHRRGPPRWRRAPPARRTGPRPGPGGIGSARRSTASRSTCAATSSAIASTAAVAADPCSAAVTRPRCRDGTASSARRGSAPSTASPTSSHAPRSTGLVPVAADPVEHDPDRPGRPGRTTRNPCSSAATTARLPAAVDHQHDRRPEQPGHVRRRAVPVGEAPVEQPHHAFDDRHLGARRAVPEQRRDPVLADQHRVQVPARPPGGQGVVAGVDVVGADLERRHGGTAPAQRGRQPGRDRRLPAPRRRCRDDQRPRRHAHGRLNEPTPTLPATRSSLGSA